MAMAWSVSLLLCTSIYGFVCMCYVLRSVTHIIHGWGDCVHVKLVIYSYIVYFIFLLASMYFLLLVLLCYLFIFIEKYFGEVSEKLISLYFLIDFNIVEQCAHIRDMFVCVFVYASVMADKFPYHL